MAWDRNSGNHFAMRWGGELVLGWYRGRKGCRYHGRIVERSSTCITAGCLETFEVLSFFTCVYPAIASPGPSAAPCPARRFRCVGCLDLGRLSDASSQLPTTPHSYGELLLYQSYYRYGRHTSRCGPRPLEFCVTLGSSTTESPIEIEIATPSDVKRLSRTPSSVSKSVLGPLARHAQKNVRT